MYDVNEEKNVFSGDKSVTKITKFLYNFFFVFNLTLSVKVLNSLVFLDGWSSEDKPVHS